MRIGIITGASSGLGRAYARQIDGSMALDELWLIARREERLVELAESLSCDCRILALDLTAEESLKLLRETLEAEKPTVSILVCAAGFGKFGRAEDLTDRETADMIALNCRCAAEVTRMCIPYLKMGSQVLEVASSAAFQPLPGMNLYAATKAFLLHYTRALRRELAQREIRVTAVCPYWVKTEFIELARQNANPDTLRSTAFAMRPEAVAAWSLTMNRLGAEIVTCGPIPLMMRLGSKLLPANVPMALWDRLRR